MTTEMTRSEKELLAARIAAKIEVIDSDISDLEEAKENYKAKINELLGDTDKSEVIGNAETGFFEYSGQLVSKFDAATAERNLPRETWIKITKPARSTTAAFARKLLTDEELALCLKSNTKKTILVKRVNDD